MKKGIHFGTRDRRGCPGLAAVPNKVWARYIVLLIELPHRSASPLLTFLLRLFRIFVAELVDVTFGFLVAAPLNSELTSLFVVFGTSFHIIGDFMHVVPGVVDIELLLVKEPFSCIGLHTSVPSTKKPHLATIWAFIFAVVINHVR